MSQQSGVYDTSDLAHDYATGAVYYMLMSEGVNQSGKEIKDMLDTSYRAFQ